MCQLSFGKIQHRKSNNQLLKDIAAFIKKEFDKKYNPTWHCIVGRNFGSYVTHETKNFIYFYMGQIAILLFKSGWFIFLNYQYKLLQICQEHTNFNINFTKINWNFRIFHKNSINGIVSKLSLKTY